jgi:ankyrin repeat protein
VKARHHVGQKRHACGIDACTFTASRKDNLQQHRSKQHGLNFRSERQEQRVNPFHIDASGGGHIPGVTHLRSSSVSSGIDEQPWTSATFLQAATIGNLFTLELSLSAAMDIDITGDDKSSALHCAARAGQSSAVRYLLERGANQQTKNKMGRSPLDEAILSRDLGTVECLLQSGAKLNDLGMTLTCLGQCGCIKILQLCLTHFGTRVTGPLLYSTLKSASRAGHISIVTGLLSLSNLETDRPGGNIDVLRQKTVPETSSPPPVKVSLFSEMLRHKFTPLHLAAAEGHLDIVQTLVYHRFEINNPVNSLTPLHLAAREGHMEVVRFLLGQETINIDYRIQYGLTPLHLAAEKGKTEVVRLLLKQDNLVVRNYNFSRNTPLHLAARFGHSEVVQLLLQNLNYNDSRSSNKHNMFPLQLAALHSHWDVAKTLFDYEKMPESQGTPAAIQQKLHTPSEVLKTLLEHPDFCDVNRLDKNGYGSHYEGLIHNAIRKMEHENFQILLSHDRIDVNLIANGITTPLFLAAKLGRTDAVKLLLQHKNIDVNRESYHWGTALQIARKEGHDEIVVLLLRHGAKDINDIALSLGSTPAVTETTTGAYSQLERSIIEDLREHVHSDVDESMDDAYDDNEDVTGARQSI